MQKLKLIFWQNIISIHQSALIRNLACHKDLDVYLAYEDDLPQSRLSMGWTIPDFGYTKLADVRVPSNYEMLVNFQDAATFHCLSGYFSFPVTWKAFYKLKHSPAKIGIMAEAFNFLGVDGWIRLQRARYYTIRWQSGIDAVLAMGKLGTFFYKTAGFSESKLLEFAYFVEQPVIEHTNSNVETKSESFRLLYVGQLIPRKGVDILLRALSLCNSAHWHLDIVGDGPQRDELHLLIQQLGIAEKVKFHGNQSNPEALKFMQAVDLLVLPSRWDGWGAVANEALMVGTPVICSDKCGAASLISSVELGRVFLSEDVQHLAQTIRQQMALGIVSAAKRNKIIEWADSIRGERGAQYFLDIIEAVMKKQIKPKPPWQLA